MSTSLSLLSSSASFKKPPVMGAPEGDRPPVSRPPEATAHEETQFSSPPPLSRHNSTPAKMQAPNHPATFGPSNRSTSLGGSDELSQLNGDNLGANYQEQSGRHHHRRQQQSSSASAASSSSSAASDSAFSQSQTTLESDGSEKSFKGDYLKRGKKEHDEASFKKKRNVVKDSYDKVSMVAESDELHFRIIWRNLSYRIQDKRFTRLTSYLRRQKERLMPKKDDQSNDDNQEVPDVDPLPLPTGDETCLPEEPPMKPPTTGKPRKLIFSGLNGCVKSGQLTAILGPSGAGKTTFLKCLTNTLVKGVSGSIDIKGGQGASQQLKLCIIPQKDYLFDNLTVMENLVFASRIKNTLASFDHLENVERVANLLGLQSCLKLKTSKISGGQYKRVSIAQELLSKPDILILDEPTSGLDSLTCFRTVSVLRDLVNKSRVGLIPPLAIIMTIHQPQIKIFNLFHHVYILSSMGKCVYEGRPEHLIDTVADCCKLLPPADDLNPASFIIDLASEVYGTEPIAQLTKLQLENSDNQEQTCNHHSIVNINRTGNSNLGTIELYVGLKNSLEANTATGTPIVNSGNSNNNNNSNRLTLDKESANSDEQLYCDGTSDCQFKISDRLKRRNNHNGSFWLHTGLLIKRLWISMWRDPLLTTTRITFHLIIPFVFYFIYSQKSGMANACPHVEREFDFQTMTSEENINRLKIQHNELILTFENVSLFFLLLYSFSMCVLAVTALSFPLNMQILLKETSNGWYSMPRFVMAKTLADLPIELTMPMISVAIAYVLTGQPSSYLCWRMLTVTAVMTLCSLISQTQGLLFGAYFMNNVQAAVFVSQASSLPWIMLSGFTTRISELPVILQWLSFGSIYRLGIESIVSVRYGFGMCPCDKELVNDTPARLVGIPDQLRSLISYYLDMYSTNDSSSANLTATTNSSNNIFEKIATTLSRANTYGIDIHNCHDVRPFILSAREVDEGTLPSFLIILVSIFIGLKILLFCVVRLRAV